MNDDRNYILDRLKSRSISIDEFNFDNLKAPPLGMFLSPIDIQELNAIATSLKLSAKPQERYRLIDQVMTRRGLVKFLSGTNRVTYRHPEFPDILFKVASDAVGIKDNPAEFYNQHLLKPFVTKIFEVSPGGVVAITERVNPITSREEFISVADDIFELITEWLIGEYVLADFGSTFFMNYGIRKGFGCVLLDYPYLYKLDGNKLYCNKPDHMSPTSKCDGVIDYDAGYNFLHCTKCGATYKAKELEQKIKNNEIINLDEGDKKMEVIIKGGSKDLKERKIRTMDTDSPAFAESMVSVGHFGEKMEDAINKAMVASAAKTAVNISNIGGSDYTFEVRTNKRSNITINKDKNDYTPKHKLENKIPTTPVVKEEVVTPIIAKEETEMTVNGVNSKVNITESPITISEETKKEFVNNDYDKEPSPVETIERSINLICRRMNEIEIDVVKDDLLERLLLAVTSMLPNNNKSLSWLISAAKDIIDADIEEASINEDIISDIKSILDYTNLEVITKDKVSEKDCNTDNDDKMDEVEYYKTRYENTSSYVDQLEVKLAEANDTITKLTENIDNAGKIYVDLEAEKIKLAKEKEALEAEIECMKSGKDDCETAKETHSPKLTKDGFTGIKTFGAMLTDIVDLLPAQEESQKIIVLTDEDGKFVAIDNLMIAIDELDGQSVDDMELVSKEYLNDLIRISEIVMNSNKDIATKGESYDSLNYAKPEVYSDDVTEDDVTESVDVIDVATQKFLEGEEKVEV